MSSDVLVETKGRTTTVTLNRPEARNSLTRASLVAIAEAFEVAARSRDVRCVVLTGAGSHFCAGADLRQSFAEDPNLMDHLEEVLGRYHRVIRAIVRCPKPTIAAIDGAAVGFGADLAFACDLRVATTAAYLQEKFVKIGLMPDGGGTFWLPRLVGTSRALRAILLAEKLEAKTLDDLGLLVKLVAPTELAAATKALSDEIEKGPPLAHAKAKAAIYASLGDFEQALAREYEGQLTLLRSQDCLEGVMAWSQKRDPDFKGE
ncbi:MAG: enoyl-CoA hydratase/isomerase family protein [Deltaproteobacteria bacterium]|nr:enoyl-CoA hydratase/isomerase family protein [Deltaproteobacteria bacterium]